MEVRDLFYATPARLKFLKGERAEQMACVDVVERLAMAHPGVAFRVLAEGDRRLLDLPAAAGDLFEARLARLTAILGRDFGANALKVEAEREGVRLSGYAGVPTYHLETWAEFRPEMVRGKKIAGVTAGASTPDFAIDEFVANLRALDPTR